MTKCTCPDKWTGFADMAPHCPLHNSGWKPGTEYKLGEAKANDEGVTFVNFDKSQYDEYRFEIIEPNTDIAFKRSHFMIGLILAAAIGLSLLFIGKAMGTTKTIVVTKLPDSLVCQPFRTSEDQKEQDKRIREMKAEPIMFQMLGKAYEAQSRGEGQVTSFSNFTCAEKLGHTQIARASTYYFVGAKKVTTR